MRYALRVLWRNPAFTIVSAVILGLGIGVNTAIFTLVNGVLLKSLPVHQPEQLLLFGDARYSGVLARQSGVFSVFPYQLFKDFQKDSRDYFEDVSAVQSLDAKVSVRRSGAGNDTPQGAVGKLVSGSYFSVLGVRPAAGRLLTAADDQAAAPAVAVISYRYWIGKYRGESSAIGDSIQINTIPFTIVGVTPPEFFGESFKTDPPELWFPLETERQLDRQRPLVDLPDSQWLFVIGRARPGINISQAQARLTLELQQWLKSRAGSAPDAEEQANIAQSKVVLTPAGSGINIVSRRYSDSLRILTEIAALVLLIACGNIASLFIARGTAKTLETSVRLALGANRWQLVRQSLELSVTLAIIGGVLGLLFAIVATRLLMLLLFQGADYVPIGILPDPSVLAFTFAVAVATGIVFGLAPAWRITRIDLAPVMRSSAGSVKSGALGSRIFGLGSILAMGQVALSLTLLIAAGLLVRSLNHLENQKFGFNPDHVLIVNIDPQMAGYKPADLPGFYQRLRDTLTRVPGVVHASYSLYSPYGSHWANSVSVQGHVPGPKEITSAWWNRVGPGFFDAVGTRIAKGRAIEETDTPASRNVAVISESFAKQYFGTENPIGKRFGMAGPQSSGDLEIVGVAEDAKYKSPGEQAPVMFYFPLLQNFRTSNAPLSSALVRSSYVHDIEIRTEGDPGTVAAAVRTAIAGIDRNIAILKISTLEEQVQVSLKQENMVAKLTSTFSLLALLLSAIGLYGLMSYTVERRTSEIGIRIALGAQRKQVLYDILRDVMVTVGIGIGAGIVLSATGTSLIKARLYGITTTDPTTIVIAAALLLAVGLLSGYLPARRASKVDPMIALRYE